MVVSFAFRAVSVYRVMVHMWILYSIVYSKKGLSNLVWGKVPAVWSL